MADPTVARHADRVLRVAQDMVSEGPVALDKSIGDSWRRCVRDYSLDPVRIYSPAVISTGDLRDRQVQHEQLIQIASAEMDCLYEQISGSGYALLLTDASGVILCEKIDPTLKSLFRSAGLLIGADWSELHEGTNGIGTCITVDGPVTVHRSEHFRARHIGLSCSGAPIHDPSGTLLAVLDASTVAARDTRSSQAHTMALVSLSAQLIEKCIFLQHHQAATIVRFHARPELVNLLHDGSLALAMDGTIVAADATATRLLATRSRSELVGKSFDEVFDTRVEAGGTDATHRDGGARSGETAIERNLRRQYLHIGDRGQVVLADILWCDDARRDGDVDQPFVTTAGCHHDLGPGLFVRRRRGGSRRGCVGRPGGGRTGKTGDRTARQQEFR